MPFRRKRQNLREPTFRGSSLVHVCCLGSLPSRPALAQAATPAQFQHIPILTKRLLEFLIPPPASGAWLSTTSCRQPI